jgi:hypothetical protein
MENEYFKLQRSISSAQRKRFLIVLNGSNLCIYIHIYVHTYTFEIQSSGNRKALTYSEHGWSSSPLSYKLETYLKYSNKVQAFSFAFNENCHQSLVCGKIMMWTVSLHNTRKV